jgi:sugar phosphate isomerase/epimerase
MMPMDPMPTLPALSVQLWSVRDQLRADLQGTLDRIAAIGFTMVEPFDIVSDPGGLRSALAASGLRAPSAHASVTRDRTPDEVFEAAVAVGTGTVVDPMIDPTRWQTADGIRGIADQLDAAADRAATYGLRLGYHNHAFELSTKVDGWPALELFAQLVDPALVLELDTYWAAVGGQDVPALLGRLGDRVRLLHLKDGPLDGVDVHQLPIGRGTLPVWPIVQATPALEVPIIEFDGYAGDIFEGLTAAFAYASAGPPET